MKVPPPDLMDSALISRKVGSGKPLGWLWPEAIWPWMAWKARNVIVKNGDKNGEVKDRNLLKFTIAGQNPQQ